MNVRVAVVGHVEVIEFLVVARVPKPGEIVHVRETFTAAAGGGGVAAVQLAKLARSCTLFTALGDDERGRAVPAELARYGVRVEAAWRVAQPQRRGVTYLDDDHERTITIIGPRHQPHPDDALPWHELAGYDAVYFTAGEPEVLRRARAARVVVGTARALPLVERSGVVLDAIVRSAGDAREPDPLPALAPKGLSPKVSVATEGARGGFYVETARGAGARVEGRFHAAPLPGPPVDAYGCGDSFAAGLTFALASRMSTAAALQLAAKCGAWCLCGRGPFAGQLRADADFDAR